MSASPKALKSRSLGRASLSAIRGFSGESLLQMDEKERGGPSSPSHKQKRSGDTDGRRAAASPRARKDRDRDHARNTSEDMILARPDLQIQQEVCDECENVVAKIHCIDCAANFCVACNDKAHSTKVQQRHQRVSVEQKNEIYADAQAQICPDHQEKLRLYCIECTAPVCLLCKECGRHQQHQVKLLQEVGGAMVKELETRLVHMNGLVNELESTNSEIEQTEKRLHSSAVSARQRAWDFFQQLLNTMTSRRDVLIAKLEEQYRMKMENALRTKDDIVLTLSELTACNDQAQRLLEATVNRGSDGRPSSPSGGKTDDGRLIKLLLKMPQLREQMSTIEKRVEKKVCEARQSPGLRNAITLSGLPDNTEEMTQLISEFGRVHCAPAAPVITDGTVQGTAITVLWQVDQGADAADVKGCQVEMTLLETSSDSEQKAKANEDKDDDDDEQDEAPANKRDSNMKAQVTVVDVLSTKHVARDLRPNTRYLFRVRAQNDEGWSPWSSARVFVTGAAKLVEYFSIKIAQCSGHSPNPDVLGNARIPENLLKNDVFVWASDPQDHRPSIVFDLGAIKTIVSVGIQHPQAYHSSKRARLVLIQCASELKKKSVSFGNDKQDRSEGWTDVAKLPLNDGVTLQQFGGFSLSGRYWRVVFLENHGYAGSSGSKFIVQHICFWTAGEGGSSR